MNDTETPPFIHPNALVEIGAKIGSGTRIWAFAHVLGGAVVGKDCNLCDHTFVEQDVVIGDRVTLKCGVYLWNGLVVEDDVFIGPSATLTNDLRPRSRQYPKSFPITRLRQGCTIGANATILPGITLGRWSMIGAGAVVTRTVPDYALMTGNPAKRKGWVCRCGERLQETTPEPIKCTCGLLYTLGNDRIDEIPP